MAAAGAPPPAANAEAAPLGAAPQDLAAAWAGAAARVSSVEGLRGDVLEWQGRRGGDGGGGGGGEDGSGTVTCRVSRVDANRCAGRRGAPQPAAAQAAQGGRSSTC
jgi:hypothetical protein